MTRLHWSRPAVGLALALLAIMPATGLSAEDEPKVTMELRQASVDSALAMLFEDTSYSYQLAPGVSGEVTMALNGVSFEEALRAILELNGLTYVRQPGDVYYITPRPAEQALSATPASGGAAQPASSAPVSPGQWFWIGAGGLYELQYLDCRDVAAWFGGQVLSGTPMIPMPIAGGGGVGIGAGAGRAMGTGTSAGSTRLGSLGTAGTTTQNLGR